MTQTPFTGSPFRTASDPAAPPPKRRGRPPGSGTGRGRKRSLKKEIGGTLALFNMGLQVSPLSRDSLDPVEIEALAQALDEEAKRSPQFRKYLEYALSVTGASSNLFAVLGIISARRAARHGYLPEVFDAQLGSLLALTTPNAKMDDLDLPEMPPMPMPTVVPDVEATNGATKNDSPTE